MSRYPWIGFIVLLVCLGLYPFTLYGSHQSHPDDSTSIDQEKSRELRKKCRSCRLTFLDRDTIKGNFIRIRNDSLQITVHEKVGKSPWKPSSYQDITHTISLDSIETVRCGDPAYDGALWGLLILGGWMGLQFSELHDPGYEYEGREKLRRFAVGFAVGGTIGALVGFALDLSIGSRVIHIDPSSLKGEIP